MTESQEDLHPDNFHYFARNGGSQVTSLGLQLLQPGALVARLALGCADFFKRGAKGSARHDFVGKLRRKRKWAGVPTEMAEQLKALQRESRELRQANENLRLFCPGGARPPVQEMIAFIDARREAYGVEPICRVQPVAPSSYHDHVARRRDPARLSDRARRDLAR